MCNVFLLALQLLYFLLQGSHYALPLCAHLVYYLCLGPFLQSALHFKVNSDYSLLQVEDVLLQLFVIPRQTLHLLLQRPGPFGKLSLYLSAFAA